MTQFQALDVQELIHLSVPRVWELLTDWAAAPEWMPGVDWMEAEQLTGPGTVLDYRCGPHERQLLITDVREEDSITLSSGGGDITVLYTYLLTEESEQACVRLTISVQAAEGLRDEVGGLLSAIADSEASTLKTLRAYAEAAP
ncbi:SRPBCC family protein [Paeniglutamicibacter antarcticus]|uniref:Polyketide cyclase/dehydrase/lipid transport protein n=1 Tax=Paeniglutamicibacter antarcticus TaxID=494023 RepID=A0ABP9TL35_9MICC